MALAGLLLAVATDDALVYSWPYGLPAWPRGANVRRCTAQHVYCCKAVSTLMLRQWYQQ